jgi:CDP-diacylglycerol--serine O-phosphatidyltransferase
MANVNAAVACIVLANVFDFFDGFAARALGVSSPIGKDLDSLADVVSFGVLPGGLLFYALNGFSYPTAITSIAPIAYLSVLVPVASALRLAKFNNDPRQGTVFYGLPTPANSVFIAGIVLYGKSLPFYEILLPLITILASWWLLAEIRLFSFKFGGKLDKVNPYRMVLVLVAIISVISLQELGLSITILAYVGLSLLFNIKNKK